VFAFSFVICSFSGIWGKPSTEHHWYDVDRVNKTIARLDRGKNKRDEDQCGETELYSLKVIVLLNSLAFIV
jgi:hypothetical protein